MANLLKVPSISGSAALEGVLKTAASPAILHLATHGYFLPAAQDSPVAAPGQANPTALISLSRFDQLAIVDNPLLRSGLAFSGANTWAQGGSLPVLAEDGILTAADVAGMNLLDTHLVVLSACETGLGQVHNGEGVYVLRRAFITAGARSLVMSLWKIPDTQTLQLMESFYTHLQKDRLGPAAALRQAQLSLRQRYPEAPFYWGAFICQGDPFTSPW